MVVKSFIDTNIFVYIYDPRDKGKQKQAIELVEQLTLSDKGHISAQVIGEFCSVMLSDKLEVKMRPADLKDIVTGILYPKLSHLPNLEFYKRAIDLRAVSSISFYDALIVQAAIDTGCKVLYSEDLQAGQTYGGVSVKNPF